MSDVRGVPYDRFPALPENPGVASVTDVV